jgi:hypothetical protein
MTSVRALALFSVAAGTALVVACGSEVNRGFEDGDGGASEAGPEPDDKGGVFSDAGSGDGGGGGGGDSASCFAPIDMYIMFDRSGSMGTDCDVGQATASKWCRSVNALSGYFKSPAAANQAAALQFFPLDSHAEPLCKTGSSYNVAAQPTGVPAYLALPTNAFDAVLNSTAPGAPVLGTPTEAAIRGLTRFSAANTRAGRVTIGVLVTDGNPNGCNDALTDLSNLLAAHYAATKVRTYVIGMEGASFDALESIAQGGGAPLHPDAVGAVADACGNGAGPCRHWNVANGDPAVFTAALAAIQESADGCKDGGGYVNPSPK